MKLNQLINPASMKHDIDNGLIRVKPHPFLPLDIYNYTEQAQFSKKWNKATTASRGLIVNRETGDIVARPFPKFFNYEERPNAIGLDEPVKVTDKMDGSLGILYPLSDGGWAVATRGSFISDQAKHATFILNTKYEDYKPPEGFTLLVEIIYPENRIVLDYGDTDDLFLLGGVHIDTGTIYGPDSFVRWPGPQTKGIVCRTMAEVVRMPPRPGKEGLVVRSLYSDVMVKLKQEDYIRLHRIVTGLNQRTVWEMLKEGLNPYEGVPDELHDWVSNIAANLQAAFDAANHWVKTSFDRVMEDLWDNFGSDWDRGQFASYAQDYLPWIRSCLFLMLDNKPIDEYIWKQLRPNGEENSYAR